MKAMFKWIMIGVAGLLLVGVGAAAGGGDPTASVEYAQVADERDRVEADLEVAEEELAAAQADLEAAQAEIETIAGDLPAREEAVVEAEAEVEERLADVKKREKAVGAAERAVAEREKAVGLVEKEIEANTITDGIYEVGKDIKPGTYKTTGGSGCYYAVLGSADTSNIINNSIGDGPSIVSVSAGQFLELSCGGAKWVLQP